MRFDTSAGLNYGIIPGFFSNYKNPADEAMGPLSQIPGRMENIYNPYIQTGQEMMPDLKNEYGELTSNPGGVLNKMGLSYKESPGFNFALQKALNAARQSMAAGGMAGSPMHEQESMDVASNLASRDYNDWLGNALNLYGAGLGGKKGLYETGFNASQSLADQIAQALAAQSALKYEGQAAENKRNEGSMGGIASLLASFLGG